ncbi:MAG: L,D-transpeptidase [Bacillota bacterium]
MKPRVFLIYILAIICIAVFAGCNTRMTGTSLHNTQPISPTATLDPTPFPSPSPTPVPTPTPFYKLAPTTVMSFEELVGDNGDYSDPPPPPVTGTYKVVVNIYHQFITVFKKDTAGNFTVPVRYMVCSSGSWKNPTPTGKFRMGADRKRFSCFTKYKVYGQYWSQVTGSIYFHSLLYSARNARYYTSSSYRMLGKRASHGCIRLLVPDARWIYYNIAAGTEIEIVYGSKNDKQAKAIKEMLVRAPLPKARPNLKPGSFAVTEAWPGYTGEVAVAAIKE